jgi:hypothetical protein
MIGCLYRLLIGRFWQCRHDWNTEKFTTAKPTWGDSEVAVIHCYHLRCKKCGDIKFRTKRLS